MKVERFDRVTIAVQNLDKAMKLFSDVLGIKIEEIPHQVISQLQSTGLRAALAPAGLELVERTPPAGQEGLGSLCFKVSDLEQAKAEMEKKGFHPARPDLILGEFKETFYNPADFHGVRLVLVEYKTPTAMEAMLKKKT